MRLCGIEELKQYLAFSPPPPLYQVKYRGELTNESMLLLNQVLKLNSSYLKIINIESASIEVISTPLDLDQLTKGVKLSLASCQFEADAFVKSLPKSKISQLKMTRVSVFGMYDGTLSLPESITSLETIECNFGLLTGSLAAAISKLPNLTKINDTKSKICSSVDYSPNLHMEEFTFNQLKNDEQTSNIDLLLEKLSSFTKLTQINLSNNNFENYTKEVFNLCISQFIPKQVSLHNCQLKKKIFLNSFKDWLKNYSIKLNFYSDLEESTTLSFHLIGFNLKIEFNFNKMEIGRKLFMTFQRIVRPYKYVFKFDAIVINGRTIDKFWPVIDQLIDLNYAQFFISKDEYEIDERLEERIEIGWNEEDFEMVHFDIQRGIYDSFKRIEFKREYGYKSNIRIVAESENL